MINLFYSILFNTVLGIILKLFEKFKLDLFQAIVFNYISCVLTGIIVQQSIPDYSDYAGESWFIFALILGGSFIFFFNVMGYIVKKMGITVMSVSNKLSLVIPVTVAFFIFSEEITFLKIAGIFMALIAVVFTSLKKENDKQAFNWKLMFWPLLLFIGSGMNDSIVKYAQAFHLQDVDNAPFNITIFSASALFGAIILLTLLIRKKTTLHLSSIIGGLLLGVPNYFSMHFFIKALSIPGYGGAIIIPVNNIAVVAVSAICAYLIFKESLSKINVAGILLAVFAILLISSAV